MQWAEAAVVREVQSALGLIGSCVRSGNDHDRNMAVSAVRITQCVASASMALLGLLWLARARVLPKPWPNIPRWAVATRRLTAFFPRSCVKQLSCKQMRLGKREACALSCGPWAVGSERWAVSIER